MHLAMTVKAEDPLPTRYSLLSRLKNWDDQDSWKDFFDIYWRLIYSVAVKSGLTDAEAKDVVQETIISVAKDLPKFKQDRTLGSFKGWLRNITRWRIADRLRKRTRLGEKARLSSVDGRRPFDVEEIADPAAGSEAFWDEQWQANLMDAAMDRVKRRVKEEHYQMFDLYVLKQWPVKRVAETLGVNVAQVYLAKHRIASLIKKEVQVLEKRW